MDVGRVCCNLPDVAGLDADEHVLRLDIRVDDLALRMQVVQSFQNLQEHSKLVDKYVNLIIRSCYKL